MFEITKDRNLLSIRLYEAQRTPYVLDINTGVFLGQQGKPIKTVPKYWRDNLMNFYRRMSTNHPLNNIVTALYDVARHGHTITTVFLHRDDWKKMLILSDRFQSINCPMDYDAISRLRTVNISNDDFRAFAKYRKDHPDISYFEWERINKLDNWCAEHHLTIDDHFTRPMAKMLFEYGIANNIKWYAYFLTRGLYDFGQHTNCLSSVMRWISTYLDRVKRMGQEPQKGDFIRLYNDAVRTYELRKAEFDNQAIAEHQNRKLHALQFEDDNFIVKVPMTSAEFIAEGEAQHNCVGRMYLPRVVNHDEHIVFIRKKSDPETSYITCEIYNNGAIGQYLLQYNNSVYNNTPEYEFKLKYQEFLYNHWDRA